MNRDLLNKTNQLQQLASNPKNSAWVFASAGSGKTKVLVDRVLRLLLADVRPDKILCLTFTKVAAVEMQNRINNELANWVLLDDTQLKQKISQLTGKNTDEHTYKKARTLFTRILDDESKIKIQTIHSFCQNLVKIFPFEAGIKPNFDVIEESQEKLLLQKAQRELFKKAQTDQSLKHIITHINAKLNEEIFSELISALLTKKKELAILKEHLFGIEGLIEDIAGHLGVTQDSNEQDIFDHFVSKINNKQVMTFAQKLEETGLKTNAKYASAITSFIHKPLLNTVDSYHQAFLTKEHKARSISGKVLDDPQLSAIFDNQISLIREFLDQINSHKIYHSTALLLRFVDQIIEIYSQLKHRNSLLDYNDLIIETNKLLDNPNFSDWVKLKMDGLFDHILVDESQDTNHQQWNIIKSLTEDFFSGMGASNKDRTIFIVGDEKQSIYSFQGANPYISQDIFSYFEEKLRDHPNPLLKINLDTSFRSLDNVLKAVDETFKGEKEKSAITKISNFQGHKAFREGSGRVEIWPQIKAKKEEKKTTSYEWDIDFKPKENYQEQDFLSEIIARRIKHMVENGYMLEGKDRAVQYGDFMILLRNRTNGFDKSLTHFFQKYDIANASPSRITFKDNIIIQDLLAAAKFALFSYDDLNLACLLKSPLFEISEEDLLTIASLKNKHDISLYEALKRLAEFSEISQRLEHLIKNAETLNCFEFFTHLLDDHDARKKIIAQSGKEGAQILDQFILRSLDFCQNFSTNLLKFLDFINKLNPEFSLSDESDNQVMVKTIHSAKGLQTPIVIIPDCCFNFNQLPGAKEKISWIDVGGYEIPIWCAKKEEQNQLLKHVAQKKRQAAQDEYLRLLYVAMTRAENELYIGGIGNSDDKDSWYSLIKKSMMSESWQEEFINKASFDAAKIETFEFDNMTLGFGSQAILSNANSAPKEPIVESSDEKNIDFYHHLQKDVAPTFSATQSSQTQISQSQIRGKLIHKILEIIGKNANEDKKWLLELANNIITKELFLDHAAKQEIFRIIETFIHSNKFEEIFSGEIKCETSVSGTIEGKMIHARIDLFTIKQDQILIIDYKTDKNPTKTIQPDYLNQLKTYEKLIKNLYPTHEVRSAILWIESLEITIS